MPKPERPVEEPEQTPHEQLPEGARDDRGAPPDDDAFFDEVGEEEADLDDADLESARNAIEESGDTAGDETEPDSDSEPGPDDSAEELGDEDDSGDDAFDAALVAEARQLGLDPEGFVTEKDLRYTLALVKKPSAASEPDDKPKPKPAAQPAALSETDQQSIAELQYQLQLSEDTDPELSQALQGMNAHYAEKAYRDSQRIAQLEQLAQQVEASAFLQRLDGYVRELGDPWETVFGKQSVTQLDRESKEFKNVVETMHTLDGIRRTMAERGIDIAEKEAFERAVYATFPKHAQNLSVNDVRGQLKGRKTISRPTHRRRNGQISPEDDAKQFVEEFARQRGFAVDDGEGDGF